ncbi:MAG: hypothetical protein SF029_14880, partial [bacterium]|nr:hypothetical protein [bacterium]
MTEIISAPITALTEVERHELALREAMIERAHQAFWTMTAEHLKAIRDARLYREKYTDFETYCRERWGFSASRARQQIAGANTARYIESVTGVTLPNESVARAVNQIPLEHQPTVVKMAAAYASSNDRPLSAPLIERTARVVDEAARTGHVDIGNGLSNPLIAAVAVEDMEAIQRQRQHMAENSAWVSYKVSSSVLAYLPVPVVEGVEVQVIVRVKKKVQP